MATQLEALLCVRDNPDIYPGLFASLMWPDAPGWTKSINVGRGATAGAGMPRAGGNWLGKLAKRGLIYRQYSQALQSLYRITQAGLDAIKEAETDLPES